MTLQNNESDKQRSASEAEIVRGLVTALKDSLELAKEMSEHGVDPESRRILREFLDNRLPAFEAALAGLSESGGDQGGELGERHEARSGAHRQNGGTRTLDTQVFADAFSTTPIGIAVESLEGQPLFVNPALCSMLGFSEQEMRNKHCVEFSPPEDAEKDWDLFKQLLDGAIERYQIEKRYFRRDRSIVWGRLSVSLLNRRSSPLVLAMVEDITDKRTQQEALSDLSRKLIDAQEQERARIARELHDDITQRLALLAVEIERMTENFYSDGSQLKSITQDLARTTIEIARDVQALSRELDSSKLGYLGLAGCAKSLCSEFSRRTRIAVKFESSELPNDLKPEVSLCVFRVLQEALQNAFKHSGSKRVEVQLLEKSGGVELIVHDSGIGFDMTTVMGGPGLGLTSMRERVRLIGGTIAIESMPRAGTTIHVRVPSRTE